MKSVQEIFENSLFRIPDYQRGYSWKLSHLDDFWQDIKNLQPGKQHYTGTITLERPTETELAKWSADNWIITGGSFKPFYVVDGQQRITTIIILLNVLLDLMEEEEQYLFQPKGDLIAKYLFKKNERNKLQSYIFGYEIDDPSYEYLKTKVFKQESPGAHGEPETVYTNNLGFADKFFREALIGLPFSHRETIFKKVSQQLKFDLKIIEDDLDIFVVFETMNNRGKPLTNLEKLKNRLIYLTSLLKKVEDDEKLELRKEINKVWKSCYEYLGKNKGNPLNDDDFLRNHFIVYHSFEKKKDFPYSNIFKDIYTVQKVVSEAVDVSYKEIRDYIRSLQKAAHFWYIIKNPIQALNNNIIEQDEAIWLDRLNRLGLRVFAPLTIAIYLLSKDKETRIEYLKQIESYIFLNYMCSGRKSTLGNTHFPNIANELYNKLEGWTITSVIEELEYYTFGDEDEDGYYTNERFIANIKDYFSRTEKNGYYDWPGIRYLLFEYENNLCGEEEKKVKWSTPNSIEHIYPQSDAEASWRESFRDFSPKQKKMLCNSLGNLVLLRGSKNSELSNKSFDFKKKHKDGNGNNAGFNIGSHSEIEVSSYRDWDAKAIYKRGKSIMNFIQVRWGVQLSNKEIKELLLIDDALISKVNVR
jgi:uncharacterized protein with ParB-like and HNH nuclease domain